MKKFIYFITLLGLWAAGCTDADDFGGNPQENPNTEVKLETAYLPISLLPTGGTGTRAGEEDNYEKGSGSETQVDEIRLYFFDSTCETPAQVRENPAKGDGYDSFIDYNKDVDYKEEITVASTDSNIEKTINLIMQLKIDSKKENQPAYVIAIINPTAQLKSNTENLTRTKLQEIVDNYDPIYAEGAYKPFLMSNSVYGDEVGETKEKKNIDYTEIKGLFSSREKAMEEINKTVIYVERVAARVDFDLIMGTLNSATKKGYTGEKYTKPGADSASAAADDPDVSGPTTPGTTPTPENIENIFYTQSDYLPYNATTTTEAEPIFVEFLGWQVVSTPKKSKLLKKIDYEGWGDKTGTDGLFKKDGEPWNIAGYYRSFWAINPTLEYAENDNLASSNWKAKDFTYYSYDEILKHGLDNKKIYVQENAADATNKKYVKEDNETKVIVAARLLNKEGEVMPIVEYGLMYYQKDDLLKYFAGQLAKHFYSDPAEAGKSEKKSAITEKDIDYLTQYQYMTEMNEAKRAGVDVKNGYLAYVALSEVGKGKTWYRDEIVEDDDTKTQKTEANKYEKEDVNKFIQGVVSNRLLVWDEGRTYYYLTVRHLGAAPTKDENGAEQVAPGTYGVVRNHIYKVNLNQLVGLGTPVLDPTETIYPEKPQHDNYLFAAEIKVLQWRVVSQDYDFTWE